MYKRKRTAYLVAALCILIFAARSGFAQNRPNALNGTWISKDAFIMEPSQGPTTWELHADGSYLIVGHQRDKANKTVWKERGTWSADDTQLTRERTSMQMNDSPPFDPSKKRGSRPMSSPFKLSSSGTEFTYGEGDHSFVFTRQDGATKKPTAETPKPKEPSSKAPSKPVAAGSEKTNTLFTAAKAGDTKRIQALLAKGSAVNGKDAAGKTALHLAAEHGHLEAVKLLVSKKADLNATDASGDTVLAAARKASLHPANAAEENNLAQVINWLNDHGASE